MTVTTLPPRQPAAEHDVLRVAIDADRLAARLAEDRTTIARLLEEIAERDQDIADLTRQLARYRAGTHRILTLHRQRIHALTSPDTDHAEDPPCC